MSDLPRLEAGMQVILVTGHANYYRVVTVDRVTAKRAYIGRYEVDRDTWRVRKYSGPIYDRPLILQVTQELMDKVDRQRLTKAIESTSLKDLSVDQLRRIHQIMEEGK